MKYDIIVGTHQKTGTVWMNQVFTNIATATGAKYYNVSRHNTNTFERLYRQIGKSRGKRAIIFDNHSDFPEQCFALNFRGIRLIRDPRDMVISAARYHETTRAVFANKPREALGGKSIRDYIAALPSFEDKLIFEIEHAIKANIDAMYRYRSGSKHLKTVKYELLIDDKELVVLPSIITYLGMTDADAAIALCIFWEQSLFGLKSKESNSHIRSGTSRQYKDRYTPAVHAAFDRGFPGVISDLAYDDPPELDSDIAAVSVPDALLVVRDALTTVPGIAGIDQALERAVPHLAQPGDLYIGYARYLLGTGEAARAEECAWRALELDEAAPAASIALGDVRAARDDWRGAERAYLTALTLAPGSSEALQRLEGRADTSDLAKTL